MNETHYRRQAEIGRDFFRVIVAGNNELCHGRRRNGKRSHYRRDDILDLPRLRIRGGDLVLLVHEQMPGR